MKVCSELGDLNSHLVPFDDPEDFEFFYKKGRLNPAVQRYCNDHHNNHKSYSFLFVLGIATMETGRCSGFPIKTGIVRKHITTHIYPKQNYVTFLNKKFQDTSVQNRMSPFRK